MSPSARRRRLLPPDSELGWTPYAWLVFLSAFYVQPALAGASVARWALYGAAGAVFVGGYFAGHWMRGRGVLWIVGLDVALAIAFCAINPGAYVFFTFAASFAARLDREREAVPWIAAISVVGLAAGAVIHAPLYFWVGHGVFTPLIGMVNLHYAQAARSNARLRAAHEAIEHLATVAERERIARDLHDVLGHTLSLIVLKSELATKMAERDPARAIQEIRDVEQVSRTALREVREAIRGIRPTVADEIARAQALLSAAHIPASVSAKLDAATLRAHDGVEETMALAIREAVTNVVRHSGASRAAIRAWLDGGTAMLEVEDNGRAVAIREGAGLRGMRARLDAVNGRLSVASGSATRVTVAIPVGITAAAGA
jgi:two-component system sensor histidine kinase DesK